LSLGCARCHDHKFDPITTREYYALAGIFTSTVTLEGIKGNNAVISGWVERPLGIEGEKRLQGIPGVQQETGTIAAAIE
jgi:hypothetical protein